MASHILPEREAPVIGRAGTFSSLRNRNYMVFWIGALSFFVGMQMQMVAQGWLVLDLTNSPFYLGLVGTVSSLPILLLSLFGGVAADRLDRRNLLIVTQALMVIPALVIAFFITTELINIWYLIIFSAFAGTVAAFNMPARQAYVADLVRRDELMNAVALLSAGMNMTRVVGPAVAGLLVGFAGIASAYYLNGIAYAFVVASLLMIPAMGRPKLSNGQNMWKNIAEGLSYVRGDEIVRPLLVIAAFGGIFGMSYMILLPALARDTLGLDATGYGFLATAGGVGALAGSLLIARLGDIRRKGWIMIASTIGFGVSIVMLAFSPNFVTAMVLQLVVGAISTASMAVNNTVLQTIVPNELRGRVMSVLMLTFGLMPMGSLLSGTAAQWVGTPIALALNGAVVAIAVAVTAILSPAIRKLD